MKDLKEALAARDARQERWVWWVCTTKHGWAQTCWDGSTLAEAMDKSIMERLPGQAYDPPWEVALVHETTRSKLAGQPTDLGPELPLS